MASCRLLDSKKQESLNTQVYERLQTAANLTLWLDREGSNFLVLQHIFHCSSDSRSSDYSSICPCFLLSYMLSMYMKYSHFVVLTVVRWIMCMRVSLCHIEFSSRVIQMVETSIWSNLKPSTQSQVHAAPALSIMTLLMVPFSHF